MRAELYSLATEVAANTTPGGGGGGFEGLQDKISGAGAIVLAILVIIGLAIGFASESKRRWLWTGGFILAGIVAYAVISDPIGVLQPASDALVSAVWDPFWDYLS